MSKASEWAEALDSQMPPEVDMRGAVRGKFYERAKSGALDIQPVVTVSAREDLHFDRRGACALVACWPTHEARLTFINGGVYSHPTFTADEALELARWIQDTFGEPTP